MTRLLLAVGVVSAAAIALAAWVGREALRGFRDVLAASGEERDG